MAVPWLRVFDTVLGLTDVARRLRGRGQAADPQEQLAEGGRGGALEARLAGVVVAALKEAFDRDHQRLELERDQLEAERQRAERSLRLELLRQAGDREIGRLRMLAGVAVASWLGTLVFSSRLIEAGGAARAALGIGWLLLLGALGATFTAQSHAAQAIVREDFRPGTAGQIAPWLIVAGLAAIAIGVLTA
jgi:hypothetical protein